MSDNLISCDYGEDQIYVHSGISSTITDSFASPAGDIKALDFISPNLISSDGTTDKIYLHSGISSTITDSFSSPDAFPSGLASDGVNLISCDNTPIPKQIYVHSGVTSTITDSFSTPGNYPSGLAFDGVNLISCDRGEDWIYAHSGITSTITDSFASPSSGPTGLAYDGSNLINCDYTSPDKIYLHSGITSTITDSFAAPSTSPSGLTYELAPNQAPTAPTSLEVDGKSAPIGANCISSENPQFSAIYNDPDAGDQSNAIQIQVGTASGLSDMWDSGWLADATIQGNRCAAKTYAGAALSVGTSYWWRCRFRDDDNAEGAWSSWQQFDVCEEEEEGRTGSGTGATGTGSSRFECEPGGSLPKRLAFACPRKNPRKEPAYRFPICSS